MKEIVTFTASVPRDEAPSGWQGIAKEYLQPLSPAQIGVSPFGMVVEYVFNHTFEVFGDSEATARGLVVSNRVYRLLTELGVSQLVFEPVRFVD